MDIDVKHSKYRIIEYTPGRYTITTKTWVGWSCYKGDYFSIQDAEKAIEGNIAGSLFRQKIVKEIP